jgi:hypothetical protein
LTRQLDRPISTGRIRCWSLRYSVSPTRMGDNMKKTPTPTYQSFLEYLDRWDEQPERMAKCDAAAKKANRERLMSPRPKHRLSRDDLWGVMVAYRGRCVYCDLRAVEKRPSNPDGYRFRGSTSAAASAPLSIFNRVFAAATTIYRTSRGPVCGATLIRASAGRGRRITAVFIPPRTIRQKSRSRSTQLLKCNPFPTNTTFRLICAAIA